MIRSIRAACAEASTGSPSHASIYRSACGIRLFLDRRTIESMNRRNPARTDTVTPINTRIPRFKLARTVSSEAAALKQTAQFINPKSQIPNPKSRTQQIQDDEHQDPNHVDEIPVEGRGLHAPEK